ncbi:unnamed protein product [Pieris brassicae]|uniref:Uncharacterized protein n=1 Tax=Pieris brassicae TaxID=7116 RepID=A0A9P0TMI3_PIEBR|nr:unnamed protein product [Pieris brassicae]
MKRFTYKLVLFLMVATIMTVSYCQEETTTAGTTAGEEEEEEAVKRSCSIWCWIQKIAMFVISQLLSG